MIFTLGAFEKGVSRRPALVVFVLCFLLADFQVLAEGLGGEAAKPFAELPSGTAQASGRQRFSPDGSFLATWGAAGLTIWDVETGDAKVKVAEGCSGFEISNRGKVLAVWTSDEVRILDPDSGSRLATLDHRNVGFVEFLPEADLLVTKESGWKAFGRLTPSEMRFWSTKTWKRFETKVDRYFPLLCPTVSPDGKYVAGYEPASPNTKSKKSQLKLWDVETGREILPPKELPDALRMAPVSAFSLGVGFTHDSKALCVYPILWDIEAAELSAISTSFDFYRDVSWPKDSVFAHPELSTQSSPNRAKIIDGKIFVWDAHEGEPIAEFVNPVKERPVNTIPHTHASIMQIPWVFDKALAFTTKDISAGSGTLDIWDAANEKITRSIVLEGLDTQLDGKQWRHDSASPQICVSKDGKTIVVLESASNVQEKKRSCRITAYDFESGKRKYRLEGHNDFVSSLCLSPDSRLIATGSGADQHRHWDANSGEVKIWDLQSGELVRTIINQGGNIFCLAFDNQGEHLAVGRDVHQSDPEVSLWKVSNGTNLLSLQRAPPEAVVRSPAGIPHIQPSHSLGQPYSLAFSPNNALLAVGGDDQLSLWNMPSGELRYLGRSDGRVHDIHFAKDGGKLYLGKRHLNEVQVSELREPQAPAQQVFRPTDAVWIDGKFAIDATGRWIASCSASFHIHTGEISFCVMLSMQQSHSVPGAKCLLRRKRYLELRNWSAIVEDTFKPREHRRSLGSIFGTRSPVASLQSYRTKHQRTFFFPQTERFWPA